jgi:hypothetical protein
MILDERTEFADAVSVIQTAGSRFNLGDVIDTQGLAKAGFVGGTGAARDLGQGQSLYLVISVDTEVITGGTAGSIQFHLVSDAVTTPDTSTATIHASSPVYVTDDSAANSAQLNAGGYPWVIQLPLDGAVYERYLGVQYNVTTTDTTAGAVSAYLTLTPPMTHNFNMYPDAVN